MITVEAAALVAERDSWHREHILAGEERVLAALSLLRREDLDRRLGHHSLGEFVVDVQRPERTLYRIAIGAANAPRVEDLVTVVYRPEPKHGS